MCRRFHFGFLRGNLDDSLKSSSAAMFSDDVCATFCQLFAGFVWFSLYFVDIYAQLFVCFCCYFVVGICTSFCFFLLYFDVICTTFCWFCCSYLHNFLLRKYCCANIWNSHFFPMICAQLFVGFRYCYKLFVCLPMIYAQLFVCFRCFLLLLYAPLFVCFSMIYGKVFVCFVVFCLL